jgi:hypothetical protein
MSDIPQGRIRVVLPAMAAAIVVVAVFGGCGIGQGGGLPTQFSDEAYPGVRDEVRGTFESTSYGCRMLEVDGETWYVIWPAGSRLDNGIRLPDGSLVDEGDTVVGIGALTPTAPLAAANEYWRRQFIDCAKGAEEVLVLDAATVDPAG